MNHLTLAEIDGILYQVEKNEAYRSYTEAVAKLREIRKFILGETKVEPKNPFLPLTQLPIELIP